LNQKEKLKSIWYLIKPANIAIKEKEEMNKQFSVLHRHITATNGKLIQGNGITWEESLAHE
jgi:hypothetical protein